MLFDCVPMPFWLRLKLKADKQWSTKNGISTIGDFQVVFSLCFKASHSAQPFIWKSVLFTCKWTKIGIWIKLKVLHQDSLWNRGKRQLGNRLLYTDKICLTKESWKMRSYWKEHAVRVCTTDCVFDQMCWTSSPWSLCKSTFSVSCPKNPLTDSKLLLHRLRRRNRLQSREQLKSPPLLEQNGVVVSVLPRKLLNGIQHLPPLPQQT